MSLHSELRSTPTPPPLTATTNFFDLPRELRDIIYSHALTSPTGYVTPLISKDLRSSSPSKSNTSRTPSYRLLLVPCNERGQSSIPWGARGPTKRDIITRMMDGIALSTLLPVANRQILEETKDLLWGTNMLVLSEPKNAMLALRHMGQAASRRIERLMLYIDPFHGEEMDKVLSMLASRSRSGKLRNITIVFAQCQLWLELRHGPPEMMLIHRDYLNLLASLTKGAALGWGPKAEGGRSMVRRRIVLNSTFVGEERPRIMANSRPLAPSEIEPVARDVHGVWDGEVMVNGTVVWKDFKRMAWIEGVEEDGRVVRRPEEGWVCDETL